MTGKELALIVAENIKTLRKAKHYSQKELARQCFTGEKVIWSYENLRVLPSLDRLVDMANVFNVDVAYLITKH